MTKLTTVNDECFAFLGLRGAFDGDGVDRFLRTA